MMVVGTAGHIDHGKSALVEALTGVNPDRLPEERARGMTIELGFATCALASGRKISIVDVPGHERFIKNMLAGASGVDAALLVVAADEGVMPQTREHLDILDLLEIRHGVVAVTKSDLVDEEWMSLVIEEIRELLRDRLLRDAPVVPVSALSGDGLLDLQAALEDVLAGVHRVSSKGPPFLPVDRVFSSRGHGTVVTGTLQGGTLLQGSEVEVLPSGLRARVRGIQVHGVEVQRVDAPGRVAVNLSGVDRVEVRRGDVVALKSTVASSNRVDVRLQVLRDAPQPLRHGQEVMAYIGAAEALCRVQVLQGDRIEPGTASWIQLHMSSPLPVIRGQHVVLRLPSPATTIAGGRIADVAATKHRRKTVDIARLCTMLLDDVDIVVEACLQSQSPRTVQEVAVRAGIEVHDAAEALQRLASEGSAVRLGDRYLSRTQWDVSSEKAAAVLARYHTEMPLKAGIPKEELRSRLQWASDTWSAAVDVWIEEGLVRADRHVVKLTGHQGGTASHMLEVERVLQMVRNAGSAPVAISSLVGDTDVDPDLIDAMISEGLLVRLDTGDVYGADTFTVLVSSVLALIKREGEVTVAQVRDLLGISRKYTLALLEYMDGERITRRSGDSRVAGNRTCSA